MMMTAAQVEKSLKKLATKEKAKASAWFFKTDEGQYGYGDIFIGVTVPEQRKIVKKFKDLPPLEIQNLLSSKVHECRLTALLILVDQSKRGDNRTQEKIAKFYLKNKKYINNWDLVDLSAPQILGEYLLENNRQILYKFARSRNIWERRIAIIATFTFIRNNDFRDTLTIAEELLSDKHDLINKATGWMLREVGKRSRPTLVKFLTHNKSRMPRTTLRYAIEHFPEENRKKFLAR